MTFFLDVRTDPIGGPLAPSVSLYQGSDISNYIGAGRDQLVRHIQGRHVLIPTHGFNVSRAAGIEHLDTWSGLLLGLNPALDAFVGLLWPGDSVWLHGLDYPGEPKVADDAGRLLAPFLDDLLTVAASVSISSHSLGARLVLRTISRLNTPVRHVILMAGAIDDDCLTGEFQAAAAKVGTISVLASKGDDVLSFAFPLGNFLSGIFDVGHPWRHGTLGRNGPRPPGRPTSRLPFKFRMPGIMVMETTSRSVPRLITPLLC